jgi:multiple sugar transport system permease protein
MPRALRPPAVLNALIAGFLGLWCMVAIFPIFWITVMSFRMPVDAFAGNPLQVILGPLTRTTLGGLGVLDIAVGVAALTTIYRGAAYILPRLARLFGPGDLLPVGWILSCMATSMGALMLVAWALPGMLEAIDPALAGIPVLGWLVQPILGATGQYYESVWVTLKFYKNFINSMIVTAGVVVLSLSVGTLAGYALARTKSRLAFWLLITALIFRALPQSVLVSGYLPVFTRSRELLMPLWQTPLVGNLVHLLAATPPTLYGRPYAVIAVLVSINQPFTIWMLRSFFQTIPAELDEAARVDGCSHFEAFRRVIMPVMWPGVITTGLFSFLLAYNDYLVCSLLLDAQSQTMVPAITHFFNRETTATDQIEAVAAAVSIIAPLFVLVMAFQRQFVSGLTAGAVKG